MAQGIGISAYINLPIANAARARTFWSEVGVPISETYSNEVCVSLSFSEHVTVMLLEHDFYRTFLNGRTVADTHAQSASLTCLDAESREAVDSFVDAALAAGAAEVPAPEPNPGQEAIDAGVMYGRTFLDPDGHQWEIMWMSPEMPPA